MAHQGPDKMDFSNLPPVVIVNILKLLEYPDFKSARRVCFNWYNASLFLDRDKLVMHMIKDKYSVNRSLCMPSDLLQSKRDVLHLSFDKAPDDIIETWLTHTTFWSLQGPKIRSLYFYYCTFNKEKMLKSLKNCVALKYLKIWNCDVRSSVPEVPISNSGEHHNVLLHDETYPLLQFPQLQSFHFCAGDGFITGNFKLFNTLLIMSPHLTSLTVELSCCSKLKTIENKYYRTVISYLESGVDIKELVFNIFGFESGKNVIPDRLLSAPNLRLRKFEAPAMLIKSFLTHQKECVEDLTLWDAPKLCIRPDECLVTLRELHCLKRLRMDGLWQPSCIRYLPYLKNLVVLRLNFEAPDLTSHYDDTTLMAALCSTVNMTMKDLELSGDQYLSERCLSEICRTHPALTRLVLDYDPLERKSGVTDVSVQSIFYYLVLLEYLSIPSDTYSDRGLRGINKSKWRNHLVIDGYAFPVGYSIARLKNLRVVCLGSSVTGRAFRFGVKLPALRHAEFFAVTAENIECFVKSHPLIERLKIPRITDYMTEAIVSNLKRLKSITVTGWYSVSDENEQILRKYCHLVNACNHSYFEEEPACSYC